MIRALPDVTLMVLIMTISVRIMAIRVLIMFRSRELTEVALFKTVSGSIGRRQLLAAVPSN